MPLIDLSSTLDDATIAEVLASNLADLEELLANSRSSAIPVRDPIRLAEITALVEAVLRLLSQREAQASRSDRIDAANLTYDLLIVATEAWKHALGLPQVPRRRTPPG